MLRHLHGSAQPAGLLRAQGLTILAVILWIAAVSAGIQALWRYSSTPGRPGASPVEWPERVNVKRLPSQSTLLLFLHPQCPCSRATIAELAQIIARCPGKATVYAFFYAPRSEGGGWVRSTTWMDAAAIPGVHPLEDPEGAAARRFGAFTSGQALLYNDRGRLVFNGGITAARGHEGPNDGQDAIVALLQNRTPRHTAAPVFGCSLLGMDSTT